MKLYDTPMAPNPRRVRWFMAEKGIEDVEIETLNLIAGDHKSPSYIRKVGLPHVPALELDNGVVITESLAICRYLESRYPHPNLFGRDAEEIAVIEMWTRRADFMMAFPLMHHVRHSHPAMGVLEDQSPALAKRYLEDGLRGLAYLDERLAGRDWIAADRLTIADILAFVGLDFGRMVKFVPPPELANVARWAEAMRARPAAQAGMRRPG